MFHIKAGITEQSERQYTWRADCSKGCILYEHIAPRFPFAGAQKTSFAAREIPFSRQQFLESIVSAIDYQIRV